MVDNPELCQNCGHERGQHYDGVCHESSGPHGCLCIRFVPPRKPVRKEAKSGN